MVAPEAVQFRCPQCGSPMAFDPAAGTLACPACGHRSAIAATGEGAVELDYAAQLAGQADAGPTVEQLTHHCTGCGAEVVLAANTVAGRCPFCGAGIVAEAVSRRVIRPQSLLPFAVPQRSANAAFRAWVAGRWFAPSSLKQRAERSAVTGAYLPAWTYDAVAESDYDGQRGDDYWDTETYTTTENGQTVTRTRQVRKTRWHSVSGHVTDRFDDVLVMASTSVPAKLVDRLEPWDLPALVPYADEYVSGFVAESYQVSLADGFGRAKAVMVRQINRTVESDIGGDHQRIDDLRTRYHHVTFKHLLLPVWISAYRYDGRTFRFAVNARTGEVQGERPYSAWKITLLVVIILVVIATIALLASHR